MSRRAKLTRILRWIGSSLPTFRRFPATTCAALVVIPPAVAMLVFGSFHEPDLLNLQHVGQLREAVVAARDEAMSRSSHFEQLLVGIGSVQLGILAYIGGVILGKEVRIERPPAFFALLIFLLFATTVAYLHTWKIYIGYGRYVVQLEMAGLEMGLRPTAHVFWLADNPSVPGVLQPATAAAASIQAVALYPVFLLAAAVVGFGLRFRIRGDVLAALLILIFGWAILYIAPDFSDFLHLVSRAQSWPSPTGAS